MSSPAANAFPSDAASGRARPIAHKFGGSSLADADRIRHVADLLRRRDDGAQVVVVSAMQGVTDVLIALVQAAIAGESHWPAAADALAERHRQVATALLGERSPPTLAWLDQQFAALRALLQALAVLRVPSREASERIQGLGEVWSAHLLAALLAQGDQPCDLLDAREVLVVSRDELGVAVEWAESRARLADWRRDHQAPRVVVTGFVARDAHGVATVLGRNGSDYSGAIFAALFDTAELHIWTDVDGVLSADPRLVPEAVALPALSYHEACELAYFGAKVVHPQTMAPVMERGIPIRIRNTFRPEHDGTRIDTDGDAGGPVKGLTLSSGLALLEVEGTGMIGVPGTAQRLFEALRAAGVSVVMISQGSSEHSICCVVRDAQAQAAQRAVAAAFVAETAHGQIQNIRTTPGISVLAAVGDGMAGTHGVAARLFGALARAQVNVRAIAQGASERNISVALNADEAVRALRAAHAAFWLSPQTISVGVIGPGKVGAALLSQLHEAIPRLRREANLDLRVRALADSRRLWLDDLGTPRADWMQCLAAADRASDLDAFAAHVHTEHLPHAVIIDCSASDRVAEYYPRWLAAGIHVITPNKQAGAGPLPRHAAIRAACAHSGARFRYEATVGAGLPVVQTLRDLLDTGDRLIAVEGILSGTLAWLFNRYDGNTPFSELVREAHALGYTEPDPRDDLSGTDVARKLVILAREAGLALSLEDVAVESLVPAALAAVERSDFLTALPQLDPAMQARWQAARARNEVLRYVAELRLDEASGSATARVGLSALPNEHAFAHLRLTDNVVQFTTHRYASNPLVVQGPGAGPDVTAAGVFADLLRVAASLGARL